MPVTSSTDPAEEPPPSLARESLLREPPVTDRGKRTREALIAAARKVFERDGYLDVRLTDITGEASCSTGTFYTYFAGKEEVFAAVLERTQEDMLHPGMPHVDAAADPVAIVEASNRAYFAAYRRNARLMGLLEQVANVDPEFGKLRQRRGEAFIRRNARSIAGLQRRGLADDTLDPVLASRALSSMVSRLGFWHFVLAPDEAGDPAGFDDLVDTATRLWANALRLPQRD